MQLSANGLKLIQGFEGYSARAYYDQNHVLTIGYGHTRGVKAGDVCTAEQAAEWVRDDVRAAEDAIHRLATVPLTQNEFDALVSLVYNIGAGAFEHSTVLRSLYAGNYGAAAEAFLLWNKTAGAVNVGLMNRRFAEKRLFLTAEE